jgi:signal transduction histidine kinase
MIQNDSNGRSIDILLIEDNPDDVELTVEALKDAKVRNNLAVVADGVEAMTFLRRQPPYTDAFRPDLVLLDLNLPRKDGREVLAEIKNDISLRPIPVVVLTTSQADEDILRAYDLHANCYITKPVDFDQFIRVIRTIIQVLLVEDNPDDVELLREMLREVVQPELCLTEVGRLEHALAHVAAEHYDVALVDLSLPDSAGLETFTRVYHGAGRRLPVIVLSGLDDEDVAMEAVHAGAQDYLVKGKVSGPVVVRSVRHAIERHRLRSELEEAWEREQAQFRQMDRLKSDLIAFVSHELRGPLTAIKMCAVTLLREFLEELDEDGQDWLSQINSEANRLARLIDAFLDIRQIDAGRPLELLRQRFSVPELVDEAVGIQRAAAVRCTFRTEYDGDVDTLFADRDKVLQILLNLLSNADKYSPKGGEVVLRVAPVMDGVQFAVVDQGVGIPPEVMPKLFTPFYRIQDQEEKGIRGTGLGLHLSKHLVEAHGGTLDVESTPGEGSVFSFIIPTSPPVEATESAEEARTS